MDKPNYIIINTVGASALFNLRNAKGLPGDLEQARQKILSLLDNPDKGTAAVEALVGLMRQFYPDPGLRLKPAEVSSLEKLNLGLTDQLYFLAGVPLSSDIADWGEVCGRALAEYYGERAKFVPLPGFVIDSTGNLGTPEVLLDVLNELVVELREKWPETPVKINLTGGYKISAIYAALIGQTYEYEVYYLQENMQSYHLLSMVDVITRLDSTSHILRKARRKRIADIEAEMTKGYELINKLERRIMVADGPITRERYSLDIEDIRTQLIELEAELTDLGYQVSK